MKKLRKDLQVVDLHIRTNPFRKIDYSHFFFLHRIGEKTELALYPECADQSEILIQRRIQQIEQHGVVAATQLVYPVL